MLCMHAQPSSPISQLVKGTSYGLSGTKVAICLEIARCNRQPFQLKIPRPGPYMQHSEVVVGLPEPSWETPRYLQIGPEKHRDLSGVHCHRVYSPSNLRNCILLFNI